MELYRAVSEKETQEDKKCGKEFLYYLFLSFYEYAKISSFIWKISVFCHREFSVFITLGISVRNHSYAFLVLPVWLMISIFTTEQGGNSFLYKILLDLFMNLLVDSLFCYGVNLYLDADFNDLRYWFFRIFSERTCK